MSCSWKVFLPLTLPWISPVLVRAGKNVVSAFVHWKAAWAYITQDVLVVSVEDIQSIFYIFIVASDRLFLLRVELDFAINSHVAKYENFDIHFFLPVTWGSLVTLQRHKSLAKSGIINPPFDLCRHWKLALIQKEICLYAELLWGGGDSSFLSFCTFWASFQAYAAICAWGNKNLVWRKACGGRLCGTWFRLRPSCLNKFLWVGLWNWAPAPVTCRVSYCPRETACWR